MTFDTKSLILLQIVIAEESTIEKCQGVNQEEEFIHFIFEPWSKDERKRSIRKYC